MILADSHDLARRFAPRPEHPAEVPLDALSPEDRRVWRALGGGAAAWQVVGVPGWHRLYLIRSASESQFDVLRRLLTDGYRPCGPTACMAMTGSGFHGHRGRPWTALEGNLHLCALFAPENLPAADAARMVMLPAVAAVDAVRAVSGGALTPGIKWVNDVLLGDAKVAGVLSATQTTGDRLDAMLFGIGLNVDRTPVVPPSPFVPSATSLAEARGVLGPDLVDAAWGVLDALGARYRELIEHGVRPLLYAYREASMIVGREVRVWPEGLADGSDPAAWPAPIARGRVTKIEENLTLRIEGVAEPVDRGRLAFEKVCRRLGL